MLLNFLLENFQTVDLLLYKQVEPILIRTNFLLVQKQLRTCPHPQRAQQRLEIVPAAIQGVLCSKEPTLGEVL